MIVPIVVILDEDQERAARLATEIEFLEDTHICIAAPANWRACCEGAPVLAIFVGPGIAAARLPGLLDGIAEWNRNVPVVLIEGETKAA